MDTSHMRTLRISPHLLGFYEGRVAGQTFADGPNWVDDGALELGVCSYALVDGTEALVFDTHITADHGRFVRRTLEAMGVRHITVVLSHWHLDHVAGTVAFADCEIVAGRLTGERLAQHRFAIEAGTLDGPPAVSPSCCPRASSSSAGSSPSAGCTSSSSASTSTPPTAPPCGSPRRACCWRATCSKTRSPT